MSAAETIPLASPNGRLEPPVHPPAASARAYLRSGLPSIYHSPGQGGQGGRFGIDFVAALEQVLDPVVVVLDCLAAYLDPDLAPLQMVDAMAAWLGIDPDEQLPEERRRELVRRGTELARRSGTRAGLGLALHVVFPTSRCGSKTAAVWRWRPRSVICPRPATAGSSSTATRRCRSSGRRPSPG